MVVLELLNNGQQNEHAFHVQKVAFGLIQGDIILTDIVSITGNTVLYSNWHQRQRDYK